MEIFTLLESLEELIEQSKKMPLSNKCIVDQEAILDLIKEYLQRPKKKQMML